MKYTIPPCIAAPEATDSSGSIEIKGSRLNIVLIELCTHGSLVEPPTNTVSDIF